MEIINKTDTLYTWLTKINKNFSEIDDKLNEDIIASDLKVKDGVLYNSLGYAICNYYSSSSNINVTIDNALFLYGLWASSRIGLTDSLWYYVHQIFATDISVSSNRKQIAYAADVEKTYTRSFYNGSWSEWKLVNDTSEIKNELNTLKESLESLIYSIPTIKESIDEITEEDPDGEYWIKGMGTVGKNGDDISKKVAIASGSTEEKSLEERFGDIVNVKDFGAVGDGITDDTEAIQTAVDLAGERKCRIYIPKGVYTVKLGIGLPSDVTVYGDGIGKTVVSMPVLPDGAYTETVKAQHGTESMYVENNAVFSSVFYTARDAGVSDITIHDLEIRGPYYRSDGKYSDYSIEWTLMNNGIDIRGRYYEQRKNLSRVRENKNICIHDVKIEGFGYTGIHADQIDHFIAYNNIVRWCGCNGIRILGCREVWCHHNDIRHLRPGDRENNTNRMYGITCSRVYGNATTDLVDGQPNPEITNIYRRSENVTLAENYIEDCLYWKGLDTHGGKNVLFLNNTVLDCHIGIGVDMAGYLARQGYVRVEDIRIEGNSIMRYAEDNPNEGGADNYSPKEKYACASSGINCVAKEESYDGGGGDLWGYNLTIRGNNLTGWGEKARNVGSINISNFKNAIINDNIIRNSRGSAISTSGTLLNAVIKNNVIRDVRFTDADFVATPWARGLNFGTTECSAIIAGNFFWNSRDTDLECIRYGENLNVSLGENGYLNSGSGNLIKISRPGIVGVCPATMMPKAYGRIVASAEAEDNSNVSFYGYGISRVNKVSSGIYDVFLTTRMYEPNRASAIITPSTTSFAGMGFYGCAIANDERGNSYVRVAIRDSSGSYANYGFYIAILSFGE